MFIDELLSQKLNYIIKINVLCYIRRLVNIQTLYEFIFHEVKCESYMPNKQTLQEKCFAVNTYLVKPCPKSIPGNN